MKKLLKKYLHFYIVFALIIVASHREGINADDIAIDSLYSISAALIDGESGRVLYEKNGFEQRAMASTTKIMTLILALEYGDDKDMVTVSSYASKMPDVQLGICEGEQYRLDDLLYSLILESHNDTAVAIAEHIGGSVEGFAEMMNSKAREIGMSDTYFITPNGLDAENDTGTHSTTAVSLALLMKYCVMDSPMKDRFIKICQTPSYSFADYEGTRSFTVHNKNAYLNMRDDVLAGKTGFTADAGYCYICAVESEGKTYIAALLGCGWPNNKTYKWHDCNILFDYAIENYEYQKVIGEDYNVESIMVNNGVERDCATLDIRDEVNINLCSLDNVSYRVRLPDSLDAPVYQGDIVGSLEVYVNGEMFETINIYADETVKEITFSYLLKRNITRFLNIYN